MVRIPKTTFTVTLVTTTEITEAELEQLLKDALRSQLVNVNSLLVVRGRG